MLHVAEGGDAPTETSMKLNYFGVVTTVPSKDCMPVARVGGHCFFIEAPKGNVLSLMETPCPAWNVPVAKPDEEATMELKTQAVPCTITLEMGRLSVDKETGKFRSPQQDISLDVPYLVPNASSFIPFTDEEGKLSRRVVLSRFEFQWEKELAEHVTQMKKLMKNTSDKNASDAKASATTCLARIFIRYDSWKCVIMVVVTIAIRIAIVIYIVIIMIFIVMIIFIVDSRI